jgi:glutathione S-transferase
MRARMALTVAKIDFELREISLRNKPAAMTTLSPKATVPVLVLPNAVIDESLDIMFWALANNDPEQWLIDERLDANAAVEMRALIATNDGSFKFHLDRMKYANRYEGADPIQHRAAAVELLRPLEERLARQEFLFGSTPRLADVAIFPFIRQFARADSPAFALLPLPRLQAWLAKWEVSALFAAVMTKQPEWQAPISEH